MIDPISLGTAWAYKNITKPMLFRLSPDTVHTNATRLGKITASIPGATQAIASSFCYKNSDFLAQTIDGIYYQNPIGLSAGFDKNFELLKLLPALGFGFIEGGSLTAEPSPGNPRPHYKRLPKSKSILVNAGLNNDGVLTIAKRIQGYGSLKAPLSISVAKTNAPTTKTETSGIKDYIKSLLHIKETGIGSSITINISCPNAYGGEPFTTPSSLEHLLQAVDEVGLKQPVYIKMPIDKDWAEFKKLLNTITKHQIAGVTIGNLAKNRQNPLIKEPVPTSWQGNLSGRPTWDLSNNLIHKTYQHYSQRLTIIGVGGVFTAEDAYHKIRLGAQLIELITGLIFGGPQIIGQMNKDLCQLLEQDGFMNIQQAIGTY